MGLRSVWRSASAAWCGTACVVAFCVVGCCPPATHSLEHPDGHTGTLLLFDEMWDYNDPAGTETAFRELLPQANASTDISYRLQLLTQIARAEGLQGRFDDAHATLDTIEAELEAAPAVVRMRYLLERGRVFNGAEDKDRARALFVEAWETGKDAKLHYYAVDAAHMLGIIEPPDQALIWSEKAIAYAEGSADKQARRWLASLYNNIGWAYFDLGRNQQALEMLQKALMYRQERGKEGPTLIAMWSVARMLRAVDRIDEALAMQQEVLARHEAAQTKDGTVFEELGELYLLKKRDADSKRFFALAYAELSQDPWIVEHEAAKLARMRKLGGLDK